VVLYAPPALKKKEIKEIKEIKKCGLL